MEEELSRLRIQSAKYEAPARYEGSLESPSRRATGVAAEVLSASLGAAAGSSLSRNPFASVSETVTPIRSRDEKDALSKLNALSHLSEPKPAEKVTYRDFIASMSSVESYVLVESGQA